MRKPHLPVCLSVMFLSTVLGAAEPSAPSKPFDTTYVCSDSFLVVAIRPQQLLKYVEKDSKLINETIAWLQEKAEFDVKNLRQFTLQFGKDLDDRDDQWSFVLQFEKPIDRPRVQEATFANYVDAKHEGKTYLRHERGFSPSGWFPDDRTMVVASEARIKQIISKAGMGPLVHRLRNVDSSSDIAIVGQFENAREQIREYTDELFESNIPHDLVDAVNALALTAKLTSDTPMQLELRIADAEKAREIKKWSDELLTLAKQKLPETKEEILDAPEEIARPALRFYEQLLDGARISARDKNVVVTLHTKGGTPYFVDLLPAPFIVIRGFGGGAERPAEKKEAEPRLPRKQP